MSRMYGVVFQMFFAHIADPAVIRSKSNLLFRTMGSICRRHIAYKRWHSVQGFVAGSCGHAPSLPRGCGPIQWNWPFLTALVFLVGSLYF